MKALNEIVESLLACNYECEAGPLKNNEDFRRLAELAGVDLAPTFGDWVSKCQRDMSDRLMRAFGTTATPQATRDEIIEKAKRDVAELVHDFESNHDCNYVNIFVNKEKRTIVSILQDAFDGHVHARGIAKCDPSDCFNVHIGKAIALRRALGLPVPTKYLNAPQPTEVRVGDIIRWIPSFSYVVDAVNGSTLDLTCVENKNVFFGHYFRVDEVEIIDDSRDDAEQEVGE